MSTTFTVGNVNLGQHSPQTWTTDGERIRMSGTIQGFSANSALVAAGQVNGLLNNPDEQAVPVIPSSDSSLSGYYRVVGGGLELGPEFYRSWWAPYTLELEELPGFASPLLESRILGALRANAHSVAVGTTVPWWATPTDATMDWVADSTTATRVGASGSMRIQYTTDGTLLYDRTQTWQCAAGDYYDGAAVIEVTYDGTNWVRAAGRRIGNAVAASAFGWRLNNGLVRVTYGGGDGLLSVQHYFSGAWVTAKIYKLTYGGVSTALGAITSITIMRNSPEVSTVRLTVEGPAANAARVNVDLTLRRGAIWVTGLATSSWTSTALGIVRNTTEAATAHTAGIHATAADAAGHKYVLNTSASKTDDLTEGGFYVTASPLPFQIGYEPASATGPDTFTNQTYSYLAATTEQVRFGRR